MIEEIKKLIKNLNDLLKDDYKILPRIVIDNSIYVPLLLYNDKIDKISPPGLVESEKNFVLGLKEFLKNNNKYSNYEIFLLRNEAKSGIGFQLESSNFYPDFIMWVKDRKKEKTHIIFIDPKGLLLTKGLNDEKVKDTPKILKEIENKLNQNISLHSFIISETKYDELTKGESEKTPKGEYEKNNIFFFEDKDWCKKLFEKLS